MKIINQFHLQAQTGTAFTVKKGQIIRVIDVEGEQVADLVCFDREKPGGYLSSGHTIDYAGKLYLSTGDILYSNNSKPMFTILNDTVGRHIFLYAPCSQEMFKITYNITEPHPNCLNNLVNNLAPYGIKAGQIHTSFNIFMNITISRQGEITIKPPLSKPGDYIDLRAETDLIIAIAACSCGTCNNFNCTPIDVEILKNS